MHRQFCEVISLIDLGRFTQVYEWCGNGCPPCPRVWLAHAFVAKSVYQFPTIDALIDALQSRPLLRQLWGRDSPGDIPSKATFFRVFATFANDQLPQRIHAAMVKSHAGNQLVGHVSRGEKIPLAPAEQQRFKARSAAERVNSLLTERYGGCRVRMRGAAKVMCHLKLGLVALTATALFARLC